MNNNHSGTFITRAVGLVVLVLVAGSAWTLWCRRDSPAPPPAREKPTPGLNSIAKAPSPPPVAPEAILPPVPPASPVPSAVPKADGIPPPPTAVNPPSPSSFEGEVDPGPWDAQNQGFAAVHAKAEELLTANGPHSETFARRLLESDQKGLALLGVAMLAKVGGWEKFSPDDLATIRRIHGEGAALDALGLLREQAPALARLDFLRASGQPLVDLGVALPLALNGSLTDAGARVVVAGLLSADKGEETTRQLEQIASLETLPRETRALAIAGLGGRLPASEVVRVAKAGENLPLPANQGPPDPGAEWIEFVASSYQVPPPLEPLAGVLTKSRAEMILAQERGMEAGLLGFLLDAANHGAGFAVTEGFLDVVQSVASDKNRVGRQGWTPESAARVLSQVAHARERVVAEPDASGSPLLPEAVSGHPHASGP